MVITCLVSAVEGITLFDSVALKCCLDLNESSVLTAGKSKSNRGNSKWKVLRQKRDQRNGKELGVPEEW